MPAPLEGVQGRIFVENPTCHLTWSNGITTEPQLVDPGTWTDPGTPLDLFDDTWLPGDCHLTEASPCIDAGKDAALHLSDYDMAGDLRQIDGDGDGTPQMDIGADEFVPTSTCESDRDGDGDVDGKDLVLLAAIAQYKQMVNRLLMQSRSIKPF